MNPSPELTTVIAELGFLAAGLPMPKEAEDIFLCLSNIRPNNENAYIGLAISKWYAHDAASAIDILKEKALRLNPESSLAKSYLGLILKVSGQGEEADSILAEVIKKDDDPQATQLAQIVTDSPCKG